MFRLLNIPCGAQGVKHREANKAEAQLMEYVESYFQSGVQDPTQRIHQTKLAPLYFQHAGKPTYPPDSNHTLILRELNSLNRPLPDYNWVRETPERCQAIDCV